MESQSQASMSFAACAAESSVEIRNEYKKEENQMFTRIAGIASVLLSSAAFLALSGGCSSAQGTSTRTVASRQETPSYDRQSRTTDNDGYRTTQAPVAKSQVRTHSSAQGSDFRIAQGTSIGGQPGLESAADRQGRVTVVSAKEPPVTPVETPSHTPTDNEFWVGGHWVADASGFSWRAGRIEPYRPGELFVAAGWAASPQGWEFTPEYWR